MRHVQRFVLYTVTCNFCKEFFAPREFFAKLGFVMSPTEVQSLSDKYLKLLENTMTSSPHTLRAYRFELAQLNLYLLQAPVVDPGDTPEFHLQFRVLAYLRSTRKNLKASSKNRRVAVLKSFFGYLFEQRLTERDLSLLLPTPKVPRTLPTFLGVDEALAVLKALIQQKRQDPKGRGPLLLFLLLYTGGLRVSEACELIWSRVEKGQLRIRGKGQKERLVPLLEITHRELQEARSRQEHNAAASIWGEKALSSRVAYSWIRAAGKFAQLQKPIHPHALRHSYATHLLQGGMNLRYLQTLLGHESLVATEKYTHLSLEDLRTQLTRNHPLRKLGS